MPGPDLLGGEVLLAVVHEVGDGRSRQVGGLQHVDEEDADGVVVEARPGRVVVAFKLDDVLVALHPQRVAHMTAKGK
jgi:hypothetical protein